jgi:hypothetical protein
LADGKRSRASFVLEDLPPSLRGIYNSPGLTGAERPESEPSTMPATLPVVEKAPPATQKGAKPAKTH